MLQIVFHIPFLNIPIYGYGLMMVATFLATQWLSARLAKARGIDPEIFINLTLIALVAGVIGARASHVLENVSDYTRSDLSLWRNLYNMINLRAGGLTLYGGVILATPVVAIYTIAKKVPPRVTMDICGPCLALGIAVGRIGCFLNGCCYGAGTTLPWAVEFPYFSDAYVDQFYGTTGEPLNHDVPPELLEPTAHGVRLRDPTTFAGNPELVALAKRERSNPVHPAELYSTFNSFLIMGIALLYFALPHVPGRCFPLVLMLDGPTRFILEMLRVEPAVWGRMSLSMVLGIVLFAAGLAWWLLLGVTQRPKAMAKVEYAGMLA